MSTQRITRIAAAVMLVLAIVLAGCRDKAFTELPQSSKRIVTSDTLLSGMCQALLPSDSFTITAILPPGQCPGHYDIKLTDIAKVKHAELIVSFRGMPFMSQTEIAADKHLVIDAMGRNWMAPPSYIFGIAILADRLIERFPEQSVEISKRKERAVWDAEEVARNLHHRIQRASLTQKPVIAASMLKEPLEWMGFTVVGEYGRPESLSASEIVELTAIGRDKQIAMIVDNLQSGPDAGKGIAEALKVPHVIFTNFPSEKGYASALSDNVNAALDAAGKNR